VAGPGPARRGLLLFAHRDRQESFGLPRGAPGVDGEPILEAPLHGPEEAGAFGRGDPQVLEEGLEDPYRPRAGLFEGPLGEVLGVHPREEVLGQFLQLFRGGSEVGIPGPLHDLEELFHRFFCLMWRVGHLFLLS
jgi:hypothetical protein